MIWIICYNVFTHFSELINLILLKKIKMMFDVLNEAQIKEVIDHNLIGRLGCHAEDKTYVVPISYASDGKYIYVRTFPGMKLEMIRKNPAVCFQVDSMIDMNDWKSVIIWGKVEELADRKERENGLNILLSRSLPNISSETVKLSPEWPFLSPISARSKVLF
ncbi:MAG: pyridoxamine 5'-phosphate oxidase family protein [Ginsengibacter sp.]